MPSGYHGCYLKVDLEQTSSKRVPIGEDALRKFLGGVGLGVHLMLKENAAKIDPLAPAAPLAFVFSPLVGSPLTTSAKFAVVCRSPLTQRWNDSLASSALAIAGKRTGADAILLVGKALEPSVLVIDDGAVRLDSAASLWAKETTACVKVLEETYPGYQFATIGPAGENLVPFATISHDGRHAGRGGSGAVLGAKNIKAIAIRGTQRVGWAKPNELLAISKELSAKSLGAATAKYRELGTAGNLLAFNRLNALPTRNFSQGSFEDANELAPETLAATREKTRTSCAACTIGCEHLYALSDKDGETQTVRLEYENLFALGPLCGISDSQAVLETSKRCDELGLDTISAGGTIAFVMECMEDAKLCAQLQKLHTGSTDDALALQELKFGSISALRTAIELIVKREGVGSLLAQGSFQLAQQLGDAALALAPQVKGLEMPGYEPRAMQTMALGFAVGARGADHNRSGAYEADFSPEVDRRQLSAKSPRLAIESEDRSAIIDSMILCKFLRGVFTDFYAEAAEMMQAITGWEIDGNELQACAKTIVDAKKEFNIAAGWTPAEDTLPDRFLNRALPNDPAASIDRGELKQAITAYNELRGWSAEGYLS